MRKINLQMDGNQVCATWDDFDCLATSPAGFGGTLWKAIGNLIDSTPAKQINAIVTSIENEPFKNQSAAGESPNKKVYPISAPQPLPCSGYRKGEMCRYFSLLYCGEKSCSMDLRNCQQPAGLGA